MARYIDFEAVRVRLIGKVRFTDDDDDENKMHTKLAKRLINEAEGAVEYDLSPRYYTPFQTVNEGAFASLPERPTKEYLRTLCELKACIRILETDFGSGTAVDGEKYANIISKRYQKMVDQLLEKKGDNQLGWKYPPLTDLRSAYFNTEADDGYAGAILTTSQGDGGYPARQINDPSESFMNGVLDDDE